MGRTGGFACIKEKYVSGERVRETLIYDGGGTYTRIIDRGGREIVETRELQTFVENFLRFDWLFLKKIKGSHKLPLSNTLLS